MSCLAGRNAGAGIRDISTGNGQLSSKTGSAQASKSRIGNSGLIGDG